MSRLRDGNAWDFRTLPGTVQNDLLKEVHRRVELIFSATAGDEDSYRSVCLTNENVPEWNTISISVLTHHAVAGSTAVQEWPSPAGMESRMCGGRFRAGLDVDNSRHGCPFFFQMHTIIFWRRWPSFEKRRGGCGKDHAVAVQSPESAFVDAAFPPPRRRYRL